MKTKLSSLLLAATILAGCSATKEPIVMEQFTVNEGDSYAKTLMRRTGSNKFVDSETGEEVTREVAGSTAMTVLQLAMLDFAGAAQNSVFDSMIENEPLAQDGLLMVEVSFDGAAQNQLIEKANNRLSTLLENAEFNIKEVKETRSQRLYIFDADSASCQSLRPTKECAVYPHKGIVTTVDTTQNKAYVVYTNAGLTLLYSLIKTNASDIHMYMPPKTKFYDFQAANSLKMPIVISQGKIHKFVKGHSINNAISHKDVNFFYRLKPSNGDTYIYQFDVEQHYFELLKQIPKS